MFGRQDDQSTTGVVAQSNQEPTADDTLTHDENSMTMTSDPEVHPDTSIGASPQTFSTDSDSVSPPADDTTSVEQNDADQPAGDDNVDDTSIITAANPTTAPGLVPSYDTPTAVTTPSSNDNNDDLLSIKQSALQQLSPLIDHLDQTPEEKFRTTMMMIQASDDQSLIRSTFEAAKQISDDKVRAQALLDIINEINYFTQQH